MKTLHCIFATLFVATLGFAGNVQAREEVGMLGPSSNEKVHMYGFGGYSSFYPASAIERKDREHAADGSGGVMIEGIEAGQVRKNLNAGFRLGVLYEGAHRGGPFFQFTRRYNVTQGFSLQAFMGPYAHSRAKYTTDPETEKVGVALLSGVGINLRPTQLVDVRIILEAQSVLSTSGMHSRIGYVGFGFPW